MKTPELFSYTITRPYPSQFTWFITSGAVVLAALFSVVAVASNAYQFESTYEWDMNSTISTKQWFQKAPFSWLSNMDSTCEAMPLAVGTVYTTSNRGFQYTVDGIRPHGKSIRDAFPTAPYRNATMRDCSVLEITIDIARRDNSQLARNYWAWGATQAHAVVGCATWSDNGEIEVNFTTKLPQVQFRDQIVNNFYKQNTSGPPGMWYGVNILGSWYGQISTAMGFSVPAPGSLTDPGDISWGAGWITLTRNRNVSNYEDERLFECFATLSMDNGGLAYMLAPATIQDWTNQWTPDTGIQSKLPNISIAVDAFSKTYYSLLLSDMGSNDSSNALLTPEGIEYLQSINNTFLAQAELELIDPSDSQFQKKAQDASQSGTIQHVFDAATDSDSNLNTVKPVTLFAQYLCTTPRRKGGFSLFFSVLLADIVFLSACWSLFGIVATWWLRRSNPRIEHCIGCAEKLRQTDIPLPDQRGAASSVSLSSMYHKVPGSDTALDDRQRLLVRKHSGR